MALRLALIGLFLCFPLFLAGQSGDRKGETQLPLPASLKPPPAPPLSPADALNSFQIQQGFQIELVASEPQIEDPVALAFDPDGRIYVVEMRGYMPNVDGKGESAEIGRVSILEDTDGDGRPDRVRVFLDGLVLPRALCLVKGGLLVAANGKLWFAEDTDGDYRADKLSLIDPQYAVGGTPEHQPNGLLRGLDNWIYNAKSQFRYRLIGGKWVKEKTEFRGQWGISQDNYGRLIYNVNDSHLRGDIAPPGYIRRNAHYLPVNGINVAIATNQSIHPIRMNTGVNRGYRPGVLDAAGRLREFTAACAPLIYRGDNFPPEFQGNAFVCEPGGNLVKRDLIFDGGLSLSARPADASKEFLASTDERFRPVNSCNAPDGALYLVDMYRGIIQHRTYITTHLRKEILSRGLEEPAHLGRIYRISHVGPPLRRAPHLSDASNARLVEHLSDPNGWWRDTAQRLLVERGDRSVVPALEHLALSGTNPLGRIHALWTLEGLQPDDLRPLLAILKTSGDPKVTVAALRVLEILSAGNRAREDDLFPLLASMDDRDLETRFQLALSLGNLDKARALPLLARIAARSAEVPLIRDAISSSVQDAELRLLQLFLTAPDWLEPKPGRAELIEVLAAAIVKGAKGAEVEALFEMIGRAGAKSPWQKTALLAGLVSNRGPVNPVARPIHLSRSPLALLTPASGVTLSPASVDSIERTFSWPGHTPATSPAKVTVPLNREEQARFDSGRETFQVICAACHGAAGEGIVPLAPPLAQSEWVLGAPGRIARIVLHGLSGPVHVKNQAYTPPLNLAEMPGFESLDDETIAAVLTYLRRAWGEEETPVSPGMVAAVRKETSPRQAPWTEAELLKLPER